MGQVIEFRQRETPQGPPSLQLDPYTVVTAEEFEDANTRAHAFIVALHTAAVDAHERIAQAGDTEAILSAQAAYHAESREAHAAFFTSVHCDGPTKAALVAMTQATTFLLDMVSRDKRLMGLAAAAAAIDSRPLIDQAFGVTDPPPPPAARRPITEPMDPDPGRTAWLALLEQIDRPDEGTSP